MGYACQSRGPARRNGLCWLLRAGSGSGSVLARALTLTLKWSHLRGAGADAGAGGAGAPSRDGVVDAVLWLDSGNDRHGLELLR
jgi:hypothetical protein